MIFPKTLFRAQVWFTDASCAVVCAALLFVTEGTVHTLALGTVIVNEMGVVGKALLVVVDGLPAWFYRFSW